MAPNPCQSVQGHLSAFLDGELGAAQHAQIEEHLSECPRCREQLASFYQLSRRFRESAATSVPNLWPSIESGLNPIQPAIRPGERSWRTGIAAALAASLLIGLGLWGNSLNQDSGKLEHRSLASHGEKNRETNSSLAGSEMSRMEMDGAHMLEFQQVIDDYLAKLAVAPDQAEDFLLTKYDGQRVSPNQAEALVGYPPLISRGLPAGYELASSSVVKMPCCTCFKAVCRRSDGSTLVLFEHDDDQAAWFGNRKSNMATCGDKDCCLVELNANIAATWKEGSRSITAVGARDKNEVTMLVNALKRS